LQANMRDICTPHLIHPAHRHPAPQIRVDPIARRRLAEPRLGLDCCQAHGPQQPAHAFMIDGIAPPMQPGCYPANAIGKRSPSVRSYAAGRMSWLRASNVGSRDGAGSPQSAAAQATVT
jgi:hypothetical protein